MKAADIYQQVTDHLITALEAGQANPKGWVKPWVRVGVPWMTHRNASTGKAYQGMNQWILWAQADDQGFMSDQWATFKQWSEMGHKVLKGSKGTHCIKWVPKVCKPAHPRGVFCSSCGDGFPCGFVVFNAAQVEGYEPPAPIELNTWERIERGESIIREAGDDVQLEHRMIDRAFYNESLDTIVLPEREQFLDAEGYYATALHELTHATKHESRCNRESLAKRFGDQHYAMEELVAEFGSAFLSAYTQIPDSSRTEQHGNYLANWLEVLRNDPKALAHCASKAQAAADYWISRVEAKASELVEVAS